jgi:hypothetical protein
MPLTGNDPFHLFTDLKIQRATESHGEIDAVLVVAAFAFDLLNLCRVTHKS